MADQFQPTGAAATLDRPASGTAYLNQSALDWQETGTKGFETKPLYESSSGDMTMLMKIAPGAFSEAHAHETVEEIYVLEGSFHDDENSYVPGDLIIRAPGTMHTAGSKSGALVLLKFSPG
ncbi:cupin domain-containing protein [Roseovarius sp.]|uniref:cupin domain-containing protein n=1 Tax=Roseovarius sp. TaxID=1486281 RepID=UPI003D0E808A